MKAGELQEGTVADAAERERCLDVTKSLVVQAAAGSGKTGLLVLRFLALLARVPRPEAVLAITFTRKAAGEMRRRIVDALFDASTRSEPPAKDFDRRRWQLARAVLERDAELGWRLLHSPSRLQVFTIDSFCSRIVAGTPLLSRLGGTPAVIDDATPLYREAVRRTLSSSGRELLAEKLEILLERYEMGMENLESQLVEMLGRRDQWREGAIGSHHDEAAWVARIEDGFRAAIGDEVAVLAAGAEPLLVERIHDLARQSRAVGADSASWPTLGDAHLLGDGVEAASAWRQASALLLKLKAIRKPKGYHSDVHANDTALKKLAADLFRDLEASPAGWLDRLKVATKMPHSPAFSDDGRAALGALVSVLRHADAELWQVFREAREVDHVEIAMKAVEALWPGETLEKLDARIDHILVDEFQDTNVLQCDLLRGLTSGWQPGDGRTLFLVGDPMQSIYRFRKAEVGLFLAARHRSGFFPGCPLVSATLSVNFRSTRKVIGWVNRIFSKLLGERDDASRSLVAFAEASAGPDAADGIDVAFKIWESEQPLPAAPAPGGSNGDDDTEVEPGSPEADDVEAAGLADWIAERVREREAGGPETAATTVGVLVRARNHALPLLRALEARAPELRVRAAELDHLADRMVAIDLEALTRAMLHPGDRLSWLALLRSPWIGLTLADLAALVEPDVAVRAADPHAAAAQPIPLLLRDAAALARVSGDGRARIDRLVAIVDVARAELATRRIDVVVRSAWLRLGGPTTAPDQVAQDTLDAEAFFELLSSRIRAGRVDLDDFARALRAADAPVDRSSSADVEILTIHKAKGLEFDCVVLPALGRVSGRRGYPPLALETEPEDGRLRLVAPRGARGREDRDGDKYDFLQFREARRAEAEVLRLLYVAATRARRCLLLSAAADRLKLNGDPAKRSLLAELAPALHVSEAERPRVARSEPAAARPSLRLPADFALAAPPGIADRSVETVTPSMLGDLAPERFAEGKLPAHVGTVFHAMVEKIAGDGSATWSAERVVEARAAIEHRLRAEGVLVSELDDAVQRVSDALVATLADEAGRRLLQARAGARSEWAMTSLEGGRLISAKLDLSFVADGVRWIVDFKTGRWRPPSGQAPAEYIAARCAQYAPQLASYRDLVRGLAGGDALPVRVGLYFAEWPAGRRWQDITEEVERVAPRGACNPALVAAS